MPMELIICPQPVGYNEAMEWFNCLDKEKIFILEHQNVYTAGKSIINNNNENKINIIHGIPAIHTQRGGLWTWHGKGQVVVYFIYNLKKRGLTLSEFLSKIENIVLNSVQTELNYYTHNTHYNIFADPEKRGFWFNNKHTQQNEKFGFIGLRISKGYVLHGISINYNNDLKWFDFIDPCGLGKVKITSIQEILRYTPNTNDKTSPINSSTKSYTHTLDINKFKLNLGNNILEKLNVWKNEKE